MRGSADRHTSAMAELHFVADQIELLGVAMWRRHQWPAPGKLAVCIALQRQHRHRTALLCHHTLAAKQAPERRRHAVQCSAGGVRRGKSEGGRHTGVYAFGTAGPNTAAM